MFQNYRDKLRFIWALPIGLLGVSGILKMSGAEFLVKIMQEAGISHMTFGVGLISFTCASTFLFPLTRNIGFLLCVAFSGGIIAMEWASGRPVVPGVMIQILLWLGMYFENPNFFKLKRKIIEVDQ